MDLKRPTNTARHLNSMKKSMTIRISMELLLITNTWVVSGIYGNYSHILLLLIYWRLPKLKLMSQGFDQQHHWAAERCCIHGDSVCNEQSFSSTVDFTARVHRQHSFSCEKRKKKSGQICIHHLPWSKQYLISKISWHIAKRSFPQALSSWMYFGCCCHAIPAAKFDWCEVQAS